MNANVFLKIAGLLLLSACGARQASFDASGSFEAEETIISSQASGMLQKFSVEEGQVLKAGETIGYVDTVQLYLKWKQLAAQQQALQARRPNIGVQLAALEEQLQNAQKEKIRITNLLKGDAATGKQLDDVNLSIEVIKRQIAAQRSSLEITTSGIDKDALPLELQMEQVRDQLSKCYIVNPLNGTVLTKYAAQDEMTAAGKALYKVADLSSMILRAYISGNQFPQVKLNQRVTVLTDDGKGGFKEALGIITWISDKAEFTPKTIQTKDERANMVYAIKVSLPNDGTYKIGMYGEIKF